ncbi:hypothetical protein B0T25DRAFT_523567 [Lasiosphaeria hispida]|uniref:Uncharacterized protein n=1 Tax=Lasiosphaeria hispida TaxID=260671 RepID=A0AAJ0H5B4_9PEZI|nr:hypothetical protein B0T25DRAFT_523567 [Lasiosphaeria hispida]
MVSPRFRAESQRQETPGGLISEERAVSATELRSLGEVLTPAPPVLRIGHGLYATSAVTSVTSPNVRGALDIVWSCLAILELCTWSILRLNVPMQTIVSRRRGTYLRAIEHGC